jgi:hypothetical protein
VSEIKDFFRDSLETAGVILIEKLEKVEDGIEGKDVVMLAGRVLSFMLSEGVMAVHSDDERELEVSDVETLLRLEHGKSEIDSSRVATGELD